MPDCNVALEAVREHNAIEIVTHILADNSRFVSEAEKFDDRIFSIHGDRGRDCDDAVR
jgi:hypothetical protein